MKKIFIILLVLTSIVCFYINSGYYIESHAWKHSQGESVADWIEFDDTLYSLKGRSIYKKKDKIGVVIFCIGERLYIKNSLTKEIGYYSNKGTK